MNTEKSAVPVSTKKAELKKVLRGKTAEQKKVIRYFYGSGGCLSKTLTDAEYDAIAHSKLPDDQKQLALKKLGLTEDTGELPPAHFEGYCFTGDDVLARRGRDGSWRSTLYQSAWVFFDMKRVYVYRITVDTVTGKSDEAHISSAFSDVNNISIVQEDVEKEAVDQVTSSGKATFRRVSVGGSAFALLQPGSRFTCAMELNDETEEAIRGMKILLQSKKNSK